MTEFKAGEIVDITIKGVRIDDVNTDGTVNIIAEHSDGGPATWGMPPQALVERVAPAGWPPQPGDLWRDRVGEPWFAFNDKGADLMVPAYPVNASRGGRMPDTVLEKLGPLTLVHREGGEQS